ncbi:GTPase [Vagococcus hydrophili]|uniref:GTPase n=1 Tax=Vagococcus hydrophili TaxID=2714947 RepID=A0A6G8AXF1_9ENTE|nr:GTPase [Vagococcus hydrophili]QIL49639.1 GTPase [Vagococcus hydrophili]
MKLSKSRKIVHIAAVLGGIVCLSPIPFSDSVMLLPIQAWMIMKLYKVNHKKQTDGLIKGIMTSMTLSVIGKGLAGNLIKFIPVIGTFWGIAINVVVAVILTEMVGISVSEGLERNEIDNTNDLMAVLSKATRLIAK